MHRSHSPNDRLEVPSNIFGLPKLTFELQPIVAADTELVSGYELLYRGPSHDNNWLAVDRALLQHLAQVHVERRLFVNLANETLLSTPRALFMAVASTNDVVFELSEKLSDDRKFPDLVCVVDALTANDVQFAIDDFGSGHDGLKRIYALRRIGVVKIDGDFMRTAMIRKSAARTLQLLVEQWKSESIMVVAECIESKEDLMFAQNMQIDLVQGWFVDAMVDAAQMLA
jgi:EAL domain-containing protein (putative c-di-GMP-specific phosphodiesterase class I)